MGLKNWLINRWLKPKRSTQKPSSEPADIDDISDEYLKRSMKENDQVLRVAERLNKANLINAKTKQIKHELQKGLYEDDEDLDTSQDDEPEDLQDIIVKNLVPKVLERLSGSNSSTPNLASQNQPPDPFSYPVQEVVSKSPVRQKAEKYLDNLSDEDLKKLNERGLL